MPIYTKSKVVLVDVDTGEALALWDDPQVITARTKESHAQAAKHAGDGKIPLASSVPGKPSQRKKQNGDFLWTIFDVSRELFPGIKQATLSRLMMLSTYMNYDNELVGDDKRPLTRQSMGDILKITYRMVQYTLDELMAHGIVIESDVFRLNSDLFCRGRMNDKETKIVYEHAKAIKKLYMNGVRSLYRSANAGSIKKLSYIFRIMPFVNQEYNIVCENPLEKNRCAIRPMSAGDLAEMIGCGRNNSSRLQAMLLEPTFDVGYGPTKAVRYVSGDKLGVENHCLFINPKIYYGGSLQNEVAVLGIFT